MHIIHSSSLAYSPVGYNKPQPSVAGGKEMPLPVAGKSSTDKQDIELYKNAPVAVQIKKAFNQADPYNANDYNPPNNIKIQKALDAYTQNSNAANQLLLPQSIAGIDFYA